MPDTAGRAAIRNPFLDDVVQDPLRAVAADVESIHREAFEACRDGLRRVRQDGASWSVLLHGAAGCGKTHVLARFRRWLRGEGGRETPEGAAPVFIAVRMETAPSLVWRHLRRGLCEQLLLRNEDGAFPLRELLRRFAAPHGGGLAQSFKEREVPDLTLDLQRVLEHYERGEHLDICKAWLKGDPLHPRDLDELRLASNEGEELEEESGEDTARRVVLALTRMAAPLPVVYCFDQIEALQMGLGGNRGFGLFSKMVASLVDGTGNCLVLSSILMDYLMQHKLGSMESDYNRLSKSTIGLHPLTWEQGRELVEARLKACSELLPCPAGGVEPLDANRLREAFATENGRCPARLLIHHARKLFDEWKDGSVPPPPPVDEFLCRLLDELREQSPAYKGPYATEQILLHGLPAAFSFPGPGLQESQRRNVNFETATQRLISVRQESSMNSLAARLRHMLRDLSAEERGRLLIVRDARQPIPATAIRTRERIEELKRGGARMFNVTPETLAALDAVRSLMTQASSGDLSIDGKDLPVATVRDWLREKLPEEVQRMVRDMEEGTVAPPAEPDPLLELVQSKMVLRVEEAAGGLGWLAERVESHARANPDQIGLLAGPPAVLFHVVAAADGVAGEPA